MESIKAKIVAYMLVLTVVGTLMGLAVMKFVHAPKEPVDNQTRTQRLHGLENSSAIQSPAARKFIQNEQLRQNETNQVDDVMAGK